MKLKGMVSLCKRDKRVVILDRYRDDGTIEQFLSDGHGIYPAGDLPPLDVKTILSVFDISTEQEAKWDVDRAEAPGWLDTSDFGNDTPLHNSRVLVNYQGDVYLPLVSDAQEVFWVDCAALAPLEPPFDLYARRMAGASCPMIVAKRGMFFVAALENVSLPDAAKDELIALTHMIRAAQIDVTKEDDHD